MRRFPSLPRRVRGAWADYVVRVTEDMDARLAGQHDYLGDSSLSGGPEIRVRAALPSYAAWHTFLHELVHKWEIEGGFTMRDDDDDSDVDRLASAMLADFVRNGWVLPGERAT